MIIYINLKEKNELNLKINYYSLFQNLFLKNNQSWSFHCYFKEGEYSEDVKRRKKYKYKKKRKGEGNKNICDD